MQNHLPSGGKTELSLKYCSMLAEQSTYKILDVGFGTGTLTLLVLQHIKELFGNRFVKIVGLENDTELLNSLAESNNPVLQSIGRTRRYKDQYVDIQVLEGDAAETINKVPEGLNYVFYDMWGPQGHERHWTPVRLSAIRKKMNSNGKLATHTAATDVRLTLVKSGFAVHEGPEYPPHMKCTHATAIHF